jgi:hypothetical protein
MSFASRLYARLGGKGLPPYLAVVRRMMLAAIATAAVVLIASAAMLFNTAPKWLSLTFEPLSLFLLPGLAVDALAVSPHDLDPTLVIEGCVLFYFLAFFGFLQWRSRALQRSQKPGRD